MVKALTGEGRISGIVLMALPICLFFTVYYLNPDYVMLLHFNREIGRQMISVAIFLYGVLGAYTIRRLWISGVISEPLQDRREPHSFV
ncbi:MAG: hypothetical protein U0936_02985 [Planctomycetaceae bacterium]